MERKALVIAFFNRQTKGKFYYFCYLRHNSALATANSCTNTLPECFKKSWKAKKIHTLKVIHPFSSPQFPSYHERSSDPFKKFTWNSSQDARFTYKKYSDDRFENIPGRRSLILLFVKVLQEIINDSKWAHHYQHSTNSSKIYLYFTVKGKPGFTHLTFESHFHFILYRIEHKYGVN